MAKITAPVKDFSGTVAGVDFVEGVGDTDDENAIAYFERQGYEVSKAKAKVDIPDGEPSDSWTVAQLKAYAAEHDVDLGDAKNKPDILAVLAAEQPDS
ncbi:hypothetical protein GCM10027169_13100 [Gordonia jinhuaensis]|uniref:Rho termination factor, N-terminal domain n=1 Tax=Gordonia jinhuaensis TaxID=1517702 RepID=A0A916SY85_9ACTN|nr:hypothetical protein [Gordonia jinhuaensis]GGB22547.1 hypothetical protein GCM10011489_08440 [Gordonia jinhuaensis]